MAFSLRVPSAAAEAKARRQNSDGAVQRAAEMTFAHRYLWNVRAVSKPFDSPKRLEAAETTSTPPAFRVAQPPRQMAGQRRFTSPWGLPPGRRNPVAVTAPSRLVSVAARNACQIVSAWPRSRLVGHDEAKMAASFHC